MKVAPESPLLLVELACFCTNAKGSPSMFDVVANVKTKFKTAKTDDEHVMIRAIKEKASTILELSNVSKLIHEKFNTQTGSRHPSYKVGTEYKILTTKTPLQEVYKVVQSKFSDIGTLDLKSFLDKYLTLHDEVLADAPSNEWYSRNIALTTWDLFYHDFETKAKNEFAVVRRLVLEFGNKEDAYLHELDVTGDFDKGIVKFNENSQQLKVRFEGHHKYLSFYFAWKKNLEDGSLLFGQFKEFVANKSFISGNVILQKSKEPLSNDSGSFKKGDSQRRANLKFQNNFFLLVGKYNLRYGRYEGVPEPIAEFLCKKWMNTTKIRTEIHSLEQLQDFLREQKERQETKTIKHEAIIKYDLFIISPNKSISNENERFELVKQVNVSFFKESDLHSHNNESRFDAITPLQNIGCKRIYFPPRELPQSAGPVSTFKSPEMELQDELASIKESRVTILIWPNKSNSSATVKVGAAIALRKKVIIFTKDKKLLPLLIQEGHLKDIRIHEYSNMNEIIDLLVSQHKWAFRE